MSKYESIRIGNTASLEHTITDMDIEKFVDLTGDDNKLHISKEYASKTDFKSPVVHGMLGASFISTIIGTKLPGDGALWFSQSLEFIRPVRVGDSITVTAEVIAKNDRAETIELKTEIFNQHKQMVTTGIAKVKIVEQLIEKEKIQDTGEATLKRTVIVFGATGGIGSATAIKLAEEGFNVIIHYNSNLSAAKSLKEEIELLGREAVIVKANLLDLREISEMLNSIRRNFSSITGLVNCSTAKIPTIKFKDLDWSYIQEHFDINIRSSFMILKGIIPLMEEANYGKIVFLTTQAIETPNSDWLHYITSKAALNGFAKALAVEYASKGICINMVSPSLTDTELVADIPKRAKMLIEAKTPLKRLCTPNDVANCISYLISSKSDFITGETIRINGGQVMI